jgi:hypothetical protein
MPNLTAEIAEVVELPSGRDGSYTDQFQRTYTRLFRVRTTSERVGPIFVQFAPGVPRCWDFYVAFGGTEFDSLAVCRKVTPSQDLDDPTLWTVKAEYSTNAPAPIGAQSSPGTPEKPNKGGPSDNPELRLPKIDFDSEDVRIPLRFEVKENGKQGKAVVNGAGDPFDPLPERPVSVEVMTVERYEPGYRRGKYKKFAYAVNSVPYLGAPKWAALCYPVRSGTEQIGARLFWKIRYKIAFWPEDIDPGHWMAYLLNAGLRQKTVVGGVTKMPLCLDDRMNPVTRPVPLLGGTQMTAGQLEFNGPEYLTFKSYPQADFAELKLF